MTTAKTPNTDQLTQGRIVRYFERRITTGSVVRIVWPALVVLVHGERRCTLHVFRDPDMVDPIDMFDPIVRDVGCDRTGETPGTWHWPGDLERAERAERERAGAGTNEPRGGP